MPDLLPWGFRLWHKMPSAPPPRRTRPGLRPHDGAERCDGPYGAQWPTRLARSQDRICVSLDLPARVAAPVPARIGPRDFCLGFESREQFLHRLYAHTVGLRLGAPGQSAKYFHLPGKTVTELFDFFHATEPVWTVWPHAVWPEDPTAAKTWSDQACHGLRYGGWERLEAALRTAFVPPE